MVIQATFQGTHMTKRNIPKSPKLQNEVAIAKVDSLSQDKVSDTDLDRVSGGQSTNTAQTGVPVPRR